MNRSGLLPRALALTALVAIVVGLYVLTPHIRAERFTPVVLQPGPDGESGQVLVQVSGAVAYPGVYTVDSSTSLGEVLALAGADGDTADCSLSLAVETGDGSADNQRVDLNHADAWLLQALPGIGPDRANDIIVYRTLHGPFSCIEELTLVPGIAGATFEALKDYITVTP